MRPECPATSPASPAPWPSSERLAFDLETTGVDPCRDLPVAFALVEARGSEVAACESSLVDPGRPIPGAASAVHGITTARARAEGIPLDRAVAHLVARLLDASARKVPVVGMKLDYDLTMVDRCHRRATGRGLEEDGFAGPVLDVLVLDRHFDPYRKGRRTLSDLCGVYDVTMSCAHDAAADATAALAVLAAMCERYAELAAATAADLHRSQVHWHRGWAESFSVWREQRGQRALRDEDRTWPIAAAASSGDPGDGGRPSDAGGALDDAARRRVPAEARGC